MSHSTWIVLIALSLPAFAQQNPAPAKEAVYAPATKRIDLDVVVTDRSGKPVSGLDRQAFIVLDNKKPQPVVDFHGVNAPAQAGPMQVILLVDTVNAGFDTLAYERSEVKKFLGQSDGRLAQPVSLVFFSDTGTEAMNGGTRDGKALSAAFDAYQTKLHTIRRSAGFYGAVERYQLSLSTLYALATKEESTPGRKLLIWISPGWPYLSGPGIDLTGKQQQGIFNSIVQTSAALRRARITLYSVDPVGSADSMMRENYYEAFLKGVGAAKDAQNGDLALQVIATQSGGQALYGSSDIASLIQKAIADESNVYMVPIDAAPSERPNEYHSLVVKTENPGLTARTRSGYYAQP